MRFCFLFYVWLLLPCLLIASDRGSLADMQYEFFNYLDRVHALNLENTRQGMEQLNNYVLEQKGTFTFDKSAGSWLWQHGEGKFIENSGALATLNKQLNEFNNSKNKHGVTIYLMLGNYLSVQLRVYNIYGYESASTIAELKALYQKQGEQSTVDNNDYIKAQQTFLQSIKAFNESNKETFANLVNHKGLLILCVHRFCNLDRKKLDKSSFELSAKQIENLKNAKNLDYLKSIGIVGYRYLYSHVASNVELRAFDIQKKAEAVKPNFTQGKTTENLKEWIEQVIKLFNFENTDFITNTLTAIKKNVHSNLLTYNVGDHYILADMSKNNISGMKTLFFYGEEVPVLMNIVTMDEDHTHNEVNISETSLKIRNEKDFVSYTGSYTLSGECTVFTLPYKNRKGTAIEWAVPKDKAALVREWIYNDPIVNAIKEMEEYLGNGYVKGGGKSRTSMDAAGTEEMDCSEFVCRYIQKAAGQEKVNSITTFDLADFTEYEYITYIEGSNKSNYIPEIGDVFVWSRSKIDGHTGIVVNYNSNADIVTVIEAIGCTEPCSNDLTLNTNRNCCEIVKSSYYRTGYSLQKHDGWIGYYRIIK